MSEICYKVFCYTCSLCSWRNSGSTKSREFQDSVRYLRRSSVRHVEILACRSEFSEDRRKTSRGICLSNLTEPTKPVVYTDRGGVAGRYPPTNYSLLFILFTRMRADALSALIYTQTWSRGRGRGRERERERGTVQP